RDLRPVHPLARRYSEIQGDTRSGAAGLVPDPAGLTMPALECVRDRGAHLVAVDPESLGQLLDQIVSTAGDQRQRPETREGERLERSPTWFGTTPRHAGA